MSAISPLAFIAEGVTYGPNLRVGPFAIIEEGVALGSDCRIEGGATIKTGTVLGNSVHVHHGAVIGGAPQDHSFDPSMKTGVKIGNRTVIREGVTVSRATKAGTDTIVGEDCLFMANSHVAHDCLIADKVILANGALAAGHVVIGAHAFISGNCAIHQHCILGEQVMCSGLTMLTANLPPFCTAAERNRLAGLNLVGLRRRGITGERLAEIRAAYRAVYLAGGLNLQENAQAALKTGAYKSKEALSFLEFFQKTKRPSFARPKKGRAAE